MEQRLGPIGAKKLGPNGTKFREKIIDNKYIATNTLN